MKKYLLVLAAAIAIATGSWYAYAAHSRNMPLLPSQAPAAATANLTSARQQLRLFTQLAASTAAAGLRPPLLHLANSAGIFNLPDAHWMAAALLHCLRS